METKGSSKNGRNAATPIRVFGCRYCSRTFLDSRALGGHQNAHRKVKRTALGTVSNRNYLRQMGMMSPHGLDLNRPPPAAMAGSPDASTNSPPGMVVAAYHYQESDQSDCVRNLDLDLRL